MEIVKGNRSSQSPDNVTSSDKWFPFMGSVSLAKNLKSDSEESLRIILCRVWEKNNNRASKLWTSEAARRRKMDKGRKAWCFESGSKNQVCSAMGQAAAWELGRLQKNSEIDLVPTGGAERGRCLKDRSYIRTQRKCQQTRKNWNDCFYSVWSQWHNTENQQQEKWQRIPYVMKIEQHTVKMNGSL